MHCTPGHCGCRSQKHTMWQEGGGSCISCIRSTLPPLISDTLVTGLHWGGRSCQVVHCCTMSLSGIWVPRQMIITEIQISRKKIIEWATNQSCGSVVAQGLLGEIFSQKRLIFKQQFFVAKCCLKASQSLWPPCCTLLSRTPEHQLKIILFHRKLFLFQLRDLLKVESVLSIIYDQLSGLSEHQRCMYHRGYHRLSTSGLKVPQIATDHHRMLLNV